MKTREVTLCASLTALALIFSWLEQFLPYRLIVPVPGLKPGFANIVLLFCLLYLPLRQGFLVLFTRCALAALLFGTGVSFFFSICGGIASFTCMNLLRRSGLSIYGISVSGAAAHSAGQMAAAVALMNTAVLSYLSPMLLFSIPCGLFTAFVAASVFPRLPPALFRDFP